jgi:hypothetical protein
MRFNLSCVFAHAVAPLGKNTGWLPAVENRGEGLFIQLKKTAVEAWAKLPEVRDAVDSFHRGVELYNEENQSKREFKGPEYVLLHTLSWK